MLHNNGETIKWTLKKKHDGEECYISIPKESGLENIYVESEKVNDSLKKNPKDTTELLIKLYR